MVRYCDITGSNATYYKTGDMISPTTTETWGAAGSSFRLTATGAAGNSLNLYGSYLTDSYVTDTDAEDYYTVTEWWVSTNSHYLSKPAGTTIRFYILKTPVNPTLTTTAANRVITLHWRTTSLMCRFTTVNWGDGSTNDYTDVTSATHTYASNGNYIITVTIKNVLNMTATPMTTVVTVGDAVYLKKHDTIYLLNGDYIIKPIHADYQLIFTNGKTTMTLSMPHDSDVIAGRNVYLYHKFGQVFTIQSVFDNGRTMNVTCVDYITAVLNGRIVFVGTNQNDGYKVYSGKGGQVIPSIMGDNLTPTPREATAILLPTSSAIGNDISIKARYEKVSDVLSQALTDSQLVLKSVVYSVNTLVLISTLSEGAVKNVNLTTRRYCGEMRSKTKTRLATTALVAGSGEGASRTTAWQGDTTSTGVSRVEMFVDGGESTTTNELSTQEGDSVQWNLIPNAPYQIYRDFWIGDTIYVDGTAMKVTQIDYAKSSSGETTVLTLGYAITGTDSTVEKLSNNVVKNYS